MHLGYLQSDDDVGHHETSNTPREVVSGEDCETRFLEGARNAFEVLQVERVRGFVVVWRVVLRGLKTRSLSRIQD